MVQFKNQNQANNIVHIQKLLTLISLNINIKFKEMRNDSKNTMNNTNKIQIDYNDYTKINKELTEPSSTHIQKSLDCESIKKTNNRKVKETNI